MTLLLSKELGLASQLLLQPHYHEICAYVCVKWVRKQLEVRVATSY